MEKKNFRPDRILAYFQVEWKTLIWITISGLVYNLGLMAGPWSEGKMVGCLMRILTGAEQFLAMLRLAFFYVIVIGTVQLARYIKRFYVRRFANNVNRRMKRILYCTLVHKSRVELEKEGAGNVITKAVSDVDDCVEGMRKFTTEIFDTGVALFGYVCMLLYYDWRIALISLIFPPFSYMIAEKMKAVVQRTGAAYKEETGRLNTETLDRITNAITYRVYGCERERGEHYEACLTEYEQAAVKANIWNAALPPVYRVIAMAGTVMILYLGSRNIVGIGWTSWDVAAFTTFLSCYTKLSDKSSKAAKLFNAVQKAQVSWKRIHPYMERAAETVVEDEIAVREKKISIENCGEAMNADWEGGTEDKTRMEEVGKMEKVITADHLTFAYPGSDPIFRDISFTAMPGQIIGITGPVACGKSTLGRSFLCEYPYEGHLTYGSRELSSYTEQERSRIVGYLGHEPELLGDSVENNVLLGDDDDVWTWLKAVCLDEEVREMEEKEKTVVGNSGVRLSGGQAARLALARTLCHKKPILVLDDPFSALDRRTEKQVFEHVKAYSKDRIVFLISHRLYLFPELDQVIWMDRKMGVCKSHERMMAENLQYAELYRAQVSKKEAKEECSLTGERRRK
ncbi:Multidrug resistance ABC transporter ATP-binding and permease protein [uncultured Clostridium sp.]|nr:Multidrug resistance ABC transporter ATP-binding and permease protein [uncultured Clostridium sp.]